MQVDQLIHAKWLIPMQEAGQVLIDHALAVIGKNIVAILPSDACHHITARETLFLPEHVLMPGLVNLHGHSARSLLRGFADDLPMNTWLTQSIWPVEKAHMDLPFVYDGTLLAMAEMLKGGTTTINDMYFYPAAVGKAALRMGMRTMVGCTILEEKSRYAGHAQAYIDQALATQTAFYGDDLISFVLAPHSPSTVSNQTFEQIVEIAEQNNLLIHCHLHETVAEIEMSLKEYGKRPLTRLHDLGVLSPRFCAADMVCLNEEDMALCVDTGLHIAHNPASNMKLASGFAPIQDLLNVCVNVGLGTDSAASNNKLDMFADMRLAALIGKGYGQDASALKAYDVLQMATINGAKALHLADKIGSLQVGKRADMVAVDMSSVGTQPIFDPISHLVYATDRTQVSHTWVNGVCLVANGQLTEVNEEELRIKAHAWRGKIKH